MANDTNSRVKSATRGSFVRRAPAKYTHGEPEEISARVGGTFKTLPDNAPSNFRQLGPDATTNKNVLDLSPDRKSGNAKFGNSRRYV